MNNIEINNNERVFGPFVPKICRENDKPIHDKNKNFLSEFQGYEPQSFATNALKLPDDWENDPNIYMLNPNSNLNWTRNFNGQNGFAEINVRQNDNPVQNQG